MTLAELITEIESQRKWLMFAGIDAYHMDIAFASILSAVLEYSDTQGKVLEKIKDEIEDLTPDYDFEGFYYCQSMAMGIVAKHISGGEKAANMERSSQYYNGGWIPVSERLPKENTLDDGYVEPTDYVLVWGDHGNYGVSKYLGNRKSKIENPNGYKDWMDLDWIMQKPIAWMPLPEPYKESEE